MDHSTMQAAIADRQHQCATCMEPISENFAIVDCCAHTMCGVCAANWYLACHRQGARFSCPLCRGKIETWMPSQSYLEHGSEEKYLRLLSRLNEVECIKGEQESVKMLDMLQTLKVEVAELRKKHERITGQDTQMYLLIQQQWGLRFESSSMLTDMIVLCTRSIANGSFYLKNSISTFSGNFADFIEKYKSILSQMNTIFICPSNANLKQNIEEASSRISRLLTSVNNLNIKALDILSTQTRYIALQNNLINSVDS